MPSRCRSSPWTPPSSTSRRRSPTRSPTPAWPLRGCSAVGWLGGGDRRRPPGGGARVAGPPPGEHGARPRGGRPAGRRGPPRPLRRHAAAEHVVLAPGRRGPVARPRGCHPRRGCPFADHLADYVDELVALEALLDPLPADRTCHRDLWADNVRGLRGGGLCVFDWDSCGPGSQSEELALVLFEFGRGEAPRHRALRDAYRDAGGPGVSQPAGLLDAHRPPRPHRGVPDQAVARGPAGLCRAGACGRRGGGVPGPAAVPPASTPKPSTAILDALS